MSVFTKKVHNVSLYSIETNWLMIGLLYSKGTITLVYHIHMLKYLCKRLLNAWEVDNLKDMHRMSWHMAHGAKDLDRACKRIRGKEPTNMIEGRLYGICIAHLNHSISCSFPHVHTSQGGPRGGAEIMCLYAMRVTNSDKSHSVLIKVIPIYDVIYKLHLLSLVYSSIKRFSI